MDGCGLVTVGVCVVVMAVCVQCACGHLFEVFVGSFAVTCAGHHP